MARVGLEKPAPLRFVPLSHAGFFEFHLVPMSISDHQLMTLQSVSRIFRPARETITLHMDFSPGAPTLVRTENVAHRP